MHSRHNQAAYRGVVYWRRKAHTRCSIHSTCDKDKARLKGRQLPVTWGSQHVRPASFAPNSSLIPSYCVHASDVQ
jgi:hypothetical protein